MTDIIVYAKYDANKSIVQIVSSIYATDTKDLKQIDKWVDGEDRYMYAHADNGEWLMQKHGKTLFDKDGRPNFHDDFVSWSKQKKDELYPLPKPQPSLQEEQMEFNVDTDYRLSMLELGLV